MKFGLCGERIVLNKDYKEMLQILLNNEIKFLIVGAYAMAAYGYPRATGDFENLSIPFISKEDLIKNKESTGRDKDKLDALYLKGNNHI